MNLGYMTNAFGALVGHGGGVTNVKDVRYLTICDDVSAIKTIASKGYKFIEVFDGNLSEYESDPNKFTQILEENNIKLLGVYIGASFIYKDALEDELFRIEKVTTLAKKMGAKHIVLGGGAVRGKGILESDYELLAKALDKANEIIKGYGLIASYHPHLGSIAEKPEQIHKLFSLTDIPFCPDIAHLVAGGGDALELVKRYFDRIEYIHLKDWDKQEFVPLGKGVINIREIVQFLKDKHYKGDYLVEIDGYSGFPEEACETSYKFLEGLL
ncbi:sugar phosphate isomerase/epimerase family protein [Alkalibacter saccharofermentans]|uniref:Inosose dehydratase n=1 Tax=Alkalibacter saccharofermentans DSM 14828 TaxID=1120975 RepID=A0A1M4USK5_9FIRM|nr:sugar phosphate isomerase/epimerase [Alkalibacter saccharofermentans]SHE59722.1 inosose dehydratase [Alkalibacter saccharofermentans DSM 14828]